jgi:hypothetical protein
MESQQAFREHLIRLVKAVRELRLLKADDVQPLAELKDLLPGDDVEALCRSAEPAEAVVDACVQAKFRLRQLSPDELLEVVKKILANPPEQETEELLKLFCDNCKHWGKADLIYYSCDYFDGNDTPSAEEITKLALTDPFERELLARNKPPLPPVDW